MKYCNDTHEAVVAYMPVNGSDCPLCLANRRLIEIADAREDIDQQAIQELTNDMVLLEKRVKQLEKQTAANIVRHIENTHSYLTGLQVDWSAS